MHNKSFTADNQASVVGGRNIGNEYFGAGAGVVFADLDVLAVGAVVPEVSNEFDLYWNSASAYPAAQPSSVLPGDAGAALQGEVRRRRARDPGARAYLDAVRTTPLVRDLLAGRLPLRVDDGHACVSDDPAKTLRPPDAHATSCCFPSSCAPSGGPGATFDLVSPYFVPGEEGTAALVALARAA